MVLTFFSNDDENFDIISALTVEISTNIFQMLDSASMVAVMQVRQSWCWLYKSDKRLKRILKEKVRKRKEAKRLLIHNLSVDPRSSWYRQPQPNRETRLGKRNIKKRATKSQARSGQRPRDFHAKFLRM